MLRAMEGREANVGSGPLAWGQSDHMEEHLLHASVNLSNKYLGLA